MSDKGGGSFNSALTLKDVRGDGDLQVGAAGISEYATLRGRSRVSRPETLLLNCYSKVLSDDLLEVGLLRQ